MVINTSPVKIEEAAQAFAAMGSKARIQVLQALVKAGSKGLAVGDIQDSLAIAASTLAHHLRFLSSAGLIVQEKDGRSIINRAAFDHLEKLADFILHECCIEENTEANKKAQKEAQNE